MTATYPIDNVIASIRSRLAALDQERAVLEESLLLLEKKIALPAARTARKRASTPRKTGRALNARPLLDYIYDYLRETERATLGDITAGVLAAGYQTSAARFSTSVYQCLYINRDRFAIDHATDMYSLVKA